MKIKRIDANSWKCPKCKKNYFRDGVQTTTLMYFPPIFRDSVNINPDRNTISFVRDCLACGSSFSISGNEHKGWDVGIIKKQEDRK